MFFIFNVAMFLRSEMGYRLKVKEKMKNMDG